MDNKTLSAQLRGLASDDVNRSKAARLRDVLEDVDFAIKAGVPRSSILAVLSGYGLNMSYGVFDTTLTRIRKQRDSKPFQAVNPATPPVIQPSPSRMTPSVVESVEDSDHAGVGSHDPAELKKILSSKVDLDALSKFAKRKKT